jgi:hypothetical protein
MASMTVSSYAAMRSMLAKLLANGEHVGEQRRK